MQPGPTPSETLAIFDLDYTLLDGDSELIWIQFVHAERLAGTEFLQTIEQTFGKIPSADADSWHNHF